MKFETNSYYENGTKVSFETRDVIYNRARLLEEVVERFNQELWRGEYEEDNIKLLETLQTIWLLNEIREFQDKGKLEKWQIEHFPHLKTDEDYIIFQCSGCGEEYKLHYSEVDLEVMNDEQSYYNTLCEDCCKLEMMS